MKSLPLVLVIIFFHYCLLIECSSLYNKRSTSLLSQNSGGLWQPNHQQNGVKMMSKMEPSVFYQGCLFCRFKCSLCKFSINYFLWKFRTDDNTYPGLPSFLTKKCVEWNIESPTVCEGFVKAMSNETLYVISKLNLGGEEICGLVFPGKCHAPHLSWTKRWLVNIPEKTSIPTSRQTRPESNTEKADTLKVLQISDIHIDMLYQEGSEVDCDEPLCCRDRVTDYRNVKQPAGRWGSYGKCDVPYRTLDNLLSHLSTQSFDYIMWTGDLPAHDDWEQTKVAQLDLLQNLTDVMLQYFPDTPVYPSLGNHESFPVNSFPPRYITAPADNISWLYEKLYQVWSPWLTQDALATVRKFGYYTMLHRPGFRIVSLNMNYCNDMNFWTLLDAVDPDSQLRWLVKVLTQAEQDQEKVHIIGHIPPAVISSNCLPVWRNNLYRIIDRFSDVITGQFYGHTHNDQVEVMYSDTSRETPISVAYVAPSVTTYIDLNPGYRVYDVSEGTWEVENHSSYIMNLSRSDNNEPSWEFLYDAKSAYNLSSLGPDSWHALLESWNQSTSETVDNFNQYYLNYYKGRPPKPHCDKDCRKKLLCETAVGNFTVSCD